MKRLIAVANATFSNQKKSFAFVPNPATISKVACLAEVAYYKQSPYHTYYCRYV